MTDQEILRYEMKIHGISIGDDGYSVRVGDEVIKTESLSASINIISEGENELKRHVREKWEDLYYLANFMMSSGAGQNSSSLDNLIFLSSVKKSFQLSSRFSELRQVSDALKLLMMSDASEMDSRLIKKFNGLYIQIRIIHRLIMTEQFRKNLLTSLTAQSKTAQVAGPYSNMDMPLKERVWEWKDGEEEYFADREKERKNSVRYNPEYDKYGFYYVWQDLNRDPYLFEDRKDESPYQSRFLVSMP